MPYKDPEKAKERNKRYYLANKDKFIDADKKRKAKNPEKYLESKRQVANRHYAKHKEEISKKRKPLTRERSLKYLYNLTLNEYNSILHLQKSQCKICNIDLDTVTNKNVAVDHCHITQQVRGILCKSCNTMLGFAKDSTEILENAINYLKQNIHEFK